MADVDTGRSLLRVILQVVGILLAWLVVITYLHHYIHVHIDLIKGVLDTPFLQLAGAILLFTALLYLLILSIPVLPNPSATGLLTLMVWVALIVLGHALTHFGVDRTEEFFDAMHASIGLAGFAFMASVYALFLAMPFVAGVEIGLLIMAMFGVAGVIVAYGGTLVGLNMAFWAGRRLPKTIISKSLQKLGLKSDASDLDDILKQSISGDGWLSSLLATMLNNRYLTIGVLLNCPGNAVVGGGGGLALISGMSKYITWPRFLLMTAVATTPVPILILLGLLNMEVFMEHTGLLHDFLTMTKSWLP